MSDSKSPVSDGRRSRSEVGPPSSGNNRTIHLENQGVAVCRSGNAKFNMAGMRRSTDVRRVNCLSCLRTALIRTRKALASPEPLAMMEVPDEVAFVASAGDDFTHEAEAEREAEHSARLEQWLRMKGWNGPRTGQMIRKTVADGFAVYMYGDSSSPCLVHLPYGDGYHYPDLRYLPVGEIERLLERQIRFDERFDTPTRPSKR